MVSSFMSSIITIIGAVILYIVYPVFVQTDTIESLDSNNTVVTTLNWIFLISYVYLFNSIHTYSHGIFYNMVSRGYVKTGYILSGIYIVLMFVIAILLIYFQLSIIQHQN